MPGRPADEPHGGGGEPDEVLLPARGWAGWIAFGLHLLTRRKTDQVFRATFTDLRIDADREHLWEVDGELVGRCRTLVVALHEEKLTLRVPSVGSRPADGRQTASSQPGQGSDPAPAGLAQPVHAEDEHAERHDQ